MRTFRIVAFWAILAMLMGSLIIYGKCMAHPVYDERGNIVAETLEDHAVVEGPTLSPLGALGEDEIRVLLGNGDPTVSDRDEVSQLDIITLLRECLGYIQDSSVIYNDPSDRDNYLTESTPAIYQLRSAQTDADDAAQAAQEQADRMQDEAERCRRETELHKKIKAMIEKLEQE